MWAWMRNWHAHGRACTGSPRSRPSGPYRIPEASSDDLQVVVVCRQGYSSGLAAASLQRVGLHRATDMIGGVEAWLADGLPVTDTSADLRE